MKSVRPINRRRFVKQAAGAAAAAVAAPMIIPSSALGNQDKPAPSNRITLAGIGVGGQGGYDFSTLRSDERVQPVAVCDVDDHHRKGHLSACGLPESAGSRDYREIIERDDIDAVMVATPDHWHVPIALAAIEAGKDVYCEKPLSLFVTEGRLLADVAKKHGRVVQVGTQRRSYPGVRLSCELVMNGYLGKLTEPVRVGVPAGYRANGGFTGMEEVGQPIPEHLDYNRWLGPAPQKPYTPGRCHFNFRWIQDYSAGYITDWGAHYMDVVQWALGMDASGPVEIEGKGVVPTEGYYDAPKDFTITYRYADGHEAIMECTDDQKKWGIFFTGEEGWIRAESRALQAGKRELYQIQLKDSDKHLYASDNHHRNFIDSVISRDRTAATPEIGHRSATVCHLGGIAVLTGRTIKWDPAGEQIIGDGEASKMLTRTARDWASEV